MAEDIIGTARGDDLEGTNAGESVWGLEGADEIRGRGGNDRVYGGDGLDDLDGGIGDDILSGGKGNDTLDGGAGFDTLTGGKGADKLDFDLNNIGRATITDFRHGTDVIDVDDFNLTFAAIMELATEADGNVTFDLGDTEFVVQNTSIAAFSATDFDFV